MFVPLLLMAAKNLARDASPRFAPAAVDDGGDRFVKSNNAPVSQNDGSLSI